jgi:hypothetical protein
MYRVRNLAYKERLVTMPDGYVVKFENGMADVPDEYIDQFQTSNYDIHTHTVPPPVAFVSKPMPPKPEVKKVVEAKIEAKPEVKATAFKKGPVKKVV